MNCFQMEKLMKRLETMDDNERKNIKKLLEEKRKYVYIPVAHQKTKPVKNVSLYRIKLGKINPITRAFNYTFQHFMC